MVHTFTFKWLATHIFLGMALFAIAVPISISPTSATAREVSKSDAGHAKNAFKFLDKRRWRELKIHMRKIKDPLLADVVNWHYLTGHGSPGNYADVRKFLNKRPDWPKRNTIVKRAEETIPSSMSPEEKLGAIVAMGGPISAMGQVRYGEALLKTGQKEAATLTLRAVWVKGNFTTAQEKNFYRRHKKLLTKDDHLKRLDRLIWEKRSYKAKRQLWKIDKKMRALAIARIWLMRKEGNVDKAIADVPENLKSDPGLLFERLRWRRRKGRLDGSIEILDMAPANVPHPEIWWVERSYLTRLALRKKRPIDAYKIASKHSLPKESSVQFSDAEWLSGWIALRFLNQPEVAKKHFENMFRAVSYPVSKARGAYWSGRAEEEMGNTSSARNKYKLAANYPTTFYGQLGQKKLNKNVSDKESNNTGAPLHHEAEIKSSDAARLSQHPLARAIRILAEIGEQKRMRSFVLALATMGNGDSWREAVAELASASGRVDLSLRIRKKAHQLGSPLRGSAYPAIATPSLKNGASVETPLVLAVIRQESAFYPGARSGAGARGMMQVMPTTAKTVARSVNMRFSRDKLLQDPNYNMVIGQTYLASLIEQFKGSYVLALAAYNAGPNRAKKWIRNHGDPRDEKIDTVDWIEMIPFNETRDYVQRVIGNLHVYRQKLTDKRFALNVKK